MSSSCESFLSFEEFHMWMNLSAKSKKTTPLFVPKKLVMTRIMMECDLLES